MNRLKKLKKNIDKKLLKIKHIGSQGEWDFGRKFHGLVKEAHICPKQE